MTDEEDESLSSSGPRVTPGMTLNEMLQSKRAAHKFAQGVNYKRAVNAASKTTFKKLGNAVRGSTKETTASGLAPLIDQVKRSRPITPESPTTRFESPSPTKSSPTRGRPTSILARKRPKSSKSRSKSPKKKRGKKKLKKLKKNKVKQVPEFELNGGSDMDDMYRSRTVSRVSMMSQASRMSKLRASDDDDDSIFREDPIMEEISTHEAAKTGNEDALELSLRRGSGLTVTTLSPHALQKNIIDETDEDGLTPLHTACKFLKAGCARILLEHGADVFKEGPEKLTALHLAARQRSRTQKEAKRKSIFLQIENEKEEIEINSDAQFANQDIPPPEDLLNTLDVVIEYMKRSKRDNPLDHADSYGDTALHNAVARKNHPAVGLLIKQGANVNLQNKQRLTALYVNSGPGDEEMLDLLLEAGADISIKDEERATPLQIAVREGHLTYVEKMISAIITQTARYGKIDKNSIKKALLDVDRNSANILHYAVESEEPDMVRYLIELVRKHDVLRSCVTAAKLNGNTALHVAAEIGNVDIVRELVKASGHAIINKKNGAKETALFIASKHNNIEVIKYLTKRSKAANAHSSDGTPLLISAAAGHLECSKVLLDNGASYTEKDKWERTLVFIAAAEGRDKYLDQILMRPQARLLVNLKDSQNNTACHVAAQRGNARVIDILIAYGADVRGKNDKDQTPMHLAVQAGNDGILKSLYQADPKLVAERDENSEIPLHIAASCGWFKCVKILLELESEVNAQNSGGGSPLICAAKTGAADIVTELIKHGAEINIQDRANLTALHHACQRGKHRIVSQLIDAGADLSLGDSEGGNCLDMAIDSYNERCVDAIITSKHWTTALSNATVTKDGEYITPMRKLINSMPEKAHDVFNRCMIVCADDEEYALNDAPRKAFESENFEIQFCFDFLDDDYNVSKWLKLPLNKHEKTMELPTMEHMKHMEAGGEGSIVTAAGSDVSQLIDKPYVDDTKILKENHPLNFLILNSRQELLTHPIVLSLYRSKWRRVGVYSYYLNLLLYLLFMIILNSYALIQPPPYSYDFTNHQCAEGSVPLMAEATNWKTDGNDCFELPESRIALGWMIIILSCFSLCKELYQIWQERLEYFTDVTNYVEWGLYGTTLCFVLDVNSLTAASGARDHWQWQIGSLAVLLSWFELMLFIQKLPRIGIYVLMFESVIKTFLDFAIVFLLFLLGFSLSFYMLAQNIPGFDTVFKSMVKNLAMMIGEFDLGDMFVYFGVDAYCDSGECDTDDWTQVAFYYKTMYFVFIVSVIIMTIIISNMLVGLAIDDIKAVQETAVLKRQALKIELALDCVYRMSGKYREKWIKMEDGRVNLKPPETWWGRVAEYLDPQELSANSIRGLQMEKVDDMERLETQVTNVGLKCNKIEHILGDICEQLNIRISQPKSDMSLL